MSRNRSSQPEGERRFNDALRSVLQVSKDELQQLLVAEKQANAGKPKRGPRPKVSGHAVSAKG
jgi:hypothetical protein